LKTRTTKVLVAVDSKHLTAYLFEDLEKIVN